MREQKLLLLSVSAGAGHVRAAEALRAQTELSYPEVEVIHLDLMEWVPKVFRQIYAESFLYIVEKQPELWGYLYGRTDRPKDGSKFETMRKAIERVNTVRFMKVLKDLNPDQVICTHFLPAQLLSRKIRKGMFKLPTWVQVTDFDVHRLWIHTHLNGYFAASEEVAYRMKDRGIDANSIAVTGIPIMPQFSQSFDKKRIAQEMGINPTKPILLLMAGGAGVGAGTGGNGLDQTAARLLSMQDDFQIIALAGKNEKLLQNLMELKKSFPSRLIPQGFTKTIEKLMAISDIAVTKPGGLTTSECLAMGLPMILVNPIPGQEERNADYLLENGAALKASDSAGLEFRVKSLIKNPKKLVQLRNNAKALGRPDAALHVLEKVLGQVVGKK